jgi:hypothetical protein
MGKLVEGLCELDKVDEARRKLQAALFRNNHDPRFRRLWNDFQFQQLQATQSSDLDTRWSIGRMDEPVLLPFVLPKRTKAKRVVVGKVIRHDDAAPPSPPHRPRTRARKSQA